MKHLRTFENIVNEDDDYIRSMWLVDTKKPNLEISLIRIGVNEAYKDKEFNMFVKRIRIFAEMEDLDEIYITSINDPYSSDEYAEFSYEKYKLPKYKYYGKVKITDEQIEEYEIENNINTYNL